MAQHGTCSTKLQAVELLVKLFRQPIAPKRGKAGLGPKKQDCSTRVVVWYAFDAGTPAQNTSLDAERTLVSLTFLASGEKPVIGSTTLCSLGRAGYATSGDEVAWSFLTLLSIDASAKHKAHNSIISA